MTTEHKKKRNKLFDALPKSLDHKLLQNAVSLLHEVQKQASDLKEDTNDEINKLISKFKGSYQDIGSKVNVVSKEAKKQAKEGVGQLIQTWNENKSGLPAKLTNEVDRLLDRVGLVRKTKASAKSAAKAKPKASKPAAAKPKAPAKKPAAKVSSAPKPPSTPKAPSNKQI